MAIYYQSDLVLKSSPLLLLQPVVEQYFDSIKPSPEFTLSNSLLNNWNVSVSAQVISLGAHSLHSTTELKV